MVEVVVRVCLTLYQEITSHAIIKPKLEVEFLSSGKPSKSNQNNQ